MNQFVNYIIVLGIAALLIGIATINYGNIQSSPTGQAPSLENISKAKEKAQIESGTQQVVEGLEVELKESLPVNYIERNTDKPLSPETIQKLQEQNGIIPGTIIVKLKKNCQDNSITPLNTQFNATMQKAFNTKILEKQTGQYAQNLKRWKKITLENSKMGTALTAYKENNCIEYANPSRKPMIVFEPNDEYFPIQWALNNTGQPYPIPGGNTATGNPDSDINAPEAWDTHTGSENVIIGVIDTGIDYFHGDLSNNMWINAGEIPNNNIDDEGNGYVDDVYGYDFSDRDGNPSDEFIGHGTHVAGIIAAE